MDGPIEYDEMGDDDLLVEADEIGALVSLVTTPDGDPANGYPCVMLHVKHKDMPGSLNHPLSPALARDLADRLYMAASRVENLSS